MKDKTTGEIDYDNLIELARKHRPKIILAGFSGYPRELDYAKFAKRQSRRTRHPTDGRYGAHCRPDCGGRARKPV